MDNTLAEDRAAARKTFNAKIPRVGGASNPDETVADGAIPAGGGSAPLPDDPATTNPLGHLDDLPGVSESEPVPGEGLPDEAPAPEPPPSPPPRRERPTANPGA